VAAERGGWQRKQIHGQADIPHSPSPSPPPRLHLGPPLHHVRGCIYTSATTRHRSCKLQLLHLFHYHIHSPSECEAPSPELLPESSLAYRSDVPPHHRFHDQAQLGQPHAPPRSGGVSEQRSRVPERGERGAESGVPIQWVFMGRFLDPVTIRGWDPR
jgi:hypothetical protein